MRSLQQARDRPGHRLVQTRTNLVLTASARRLQVQCSSQSGTVSPINKQVSAQSLGEAPYQVVTLPPLAEGSLPGLPGAAYDAPRAAQAYLWSSAQHKAGTSKGIAVIFAHGFSQGPTNYTTLFQKFTDRGWTVLAPTTTFDSFLFPWQRVETTGLLSSLPTKLQSALLLDLLRSYQYLKDSPEHDIEEVLLCGHSMGGASALIAGGYLKDVVKAVGVMAPAVKQTLQSAVNPLLHFDGVRNLSPEKYREHVSSFFKTHFQPRVDLHLLCSKEDIIVRPEEVEDIYLAALTGRGEDLTGKVLPKASAWYRIPWGGHIGFEDNVNLDFTLPGILGLWQKLLFTIVNILIFQVDLFKFWDDPSEEYRREKTVAQDIMIDLFATSLGEKPVGKLEWSISDVDDQPPPYTLTPGQSTNVGLETQLQQGPKEAGQPLLETGLLFGYAAAQAATCGTALHLLQRSFGQGSSLTAATGLGIIAAISAGLVWENTILAAGRFITRGGTSNLDVLQQLNRPRFLFHSFAPLLSAAGINLASRAGISWASSIPFSSVTSLILGVTVVLSLVQNTLLLHTEPRWQNGILHYTYTPKPFDFVRIVPVAATTVFLTVLGVAAVKQNASLWPFPAGAAACFALSAGLIPKKIAPMILTGNLGEVLLLGGLVLAELSLS